MTAPSEIRQVLRPESAFVAGRNPDRPAPAHILNNFVMAGMGRSRGMDLVRLLSRARDAGDRLAEHPGVKGAAWVGQPGQLAALARDIGIVFDPDRRMFPSRGSPVPLDWRLASPDPSDDGLGGALWRCLRLDDQIELQAALGRILDADGAPDPASRLARFVLLGLPDSNPAPLPKTTPPPEAWYGPLLFRLLETFLHENGGGHRLRTIRELGIVLYFAAVVAVVAEGLRRRRTAESLETGLGVVVYTGLPPGEPNDVLVRAAQRSFRQVVAEAYQGLGDALAEAVRAALDSTLPQQMRVQSAIYQRLRRTDANRASKSLQRLVNLAPIGKEMEAGEWSASAMDAAYPIEHFTHAIRVMGSKVGFVGPARGVGYPRFILETPLLSTLTRVILSGERSIPFAIFIDRARDSHGLVLGIGSTTVVPVGADVFGSERLTVQHLHGLQERLRLRMIQAGLAREFSDEHTQVFIR